MRCIDADALEEVLGKIPAADIKNIDGQAYTLVRLSQVFNVIEHAPTIEERKEGKWIERNPQNSDKCRLIECDQCGFAHIVGFNVPYEDWIENRNFCERCGADMREEDEQNG